MEITWDILTYKHKVFYGEYFLNPLVKKDPFLCFIANKIATLMICCVTDNLDMLLLSPDIIVQQDFTGDDTNCEWGYYVFNNTFSLFNFSFVQH